MGVSMSRSTSRSRTFRPGAPIPGAGSPWLLTAAPTGAVMRASSEVVSRRNAGTRSAAWLARLIADSMGLCQLPGRKLSLGPVSSRVFLRRISTPCAIWDRRAEPPLTRPSADLSHEGRGGRQRGRAGGGAVWEQATGAGRAGGSGAYQP